MDINGDGLQDLLELDPNNQRTRVWINTGTELKHYDLTNAFQLSGSYGQGASANFAASGNIPLMTIWIFDVKMALSATGGGNIALNDVDSRMIDMNADGLPDLVTTLSGIGPPTTDGNLSVYFADWGKGNKLKKVHNPLGGSFSINYRMEGGKRGAYPVEIHTHKTADGDEILWDMPMSQWVMSEVIIDDGYQIVDASGADVDGADRTALSFYYDGGIKDRRNREFKGFQRVETMSSHRPFEELDQLNESQYEVISSVKETPIITSLDKGSLENLDVLFSAGGRSYTLYKKFIKQDLPPLEFELDRSCAPRLLEKNSSELEFRKVATSGAAVNEVEYANNVPVVLSAAQLSESDVVFPATVSTQKIVWPVKDEQSKYFAYGFSMEYDELFNVVEYDSLKEVQPLALLSKSQWAPLPQITS